MESIFYIFGVLFLLSIATLLVFSFISAFTVFHIADSFKVGIDKHFNIR